MTKDIGKLDGIFAGVQDKIALFLGLTENKQIGHATVGRNLSNRVGDFHALLTDLYSSIESNRATARDRLPSRENWRFEVRTVISDVNRSKEVRLEREVASLAKLGVMARWANQVPVASGFIDHKLDKRAAIDLVELTDTTARLVELKWASNTPLFAAFEIICYGLVYIFSRAHAEQLGYSEKRLMQIPLLSLQVVAPANYYLGYELGWLQIELDRELRKLANEKTDGRLEMNFGFLAFPEEFDLSDDGQPIGTSVDEAFANLRSVY